MATFLFVGLAVTLCLGAVLLLLFVAFKPRYSFIPLERRRPDGQPDQSVLGRLSQTASGAMVDVLGESGGPFKRTVLYNAGVKASPANFTVAVVCGTLFLGIVVSLVSNPWLGGVVAIATPFLVRIGLVLMTEKRRGRFELQLTDTIHMLVGGLRAGHSIMRAIEGAAREGDSPSSEELSRVVNETRIGKDPHVALEECAARMDSEDFRWISQAIQINREVGGDLAEVLEQVAGTIRERSEIKGHVRALSAEGKISAYILMALPVFLGFFISLINPGYLRPLFATPLGWILLALGVVMFIVGGFWMSRVVKIKF